jgi:hypothetical protein
MVGDRIRIRRIHLAFGIPPNPGLSEPGYNKTSEMRRRSASDRTSPPVATLAVYHRRSEGAVRILPCIPCVPWANRIAAFDGARSLLCASCVSWAIGSMAGGPNPGLSEPGYNKTNEMRKRQRRIELHRPWRPSRFITGEAGCGQNSSVYSVCFVGNPIGVRPLSCASCVSWATGSMVGDRIRIRRIHLAFGIPPNPGLSEPGYNKTSEMRRRSASDRTSPPVATLAVYHRRSEGAVRILPCIPCVPWANRIAAFDGARSLLCASCVSWAIGSMAGGPNSGLSEPGYNKTNGG